MSLFGKSELLKGPKYQLLFCPLCHTPMTFKGDKIPDNFLCADANKIVKIKVKDGETATQVVSVEDGVVTFDQQGAVAKDDARFVQGSGPLRMVRRMFRHLWPGERSPAEENEDNDRGRVHPRTG
jgi:hypothetical protein